MSRLRVLPAVFVSCSLFPPTLALAADAVVGTGTPGSCNNAAFANAVATVNSAGGTITFNCGGLATVVLTGQHIFFNSSNFGLTYAIEGGGVITLAGAGSSRLLLHASGTLNVRNITITGGRATGANDDASGAGIRSDGALLAGAAPVGLNLTNVTFTNNVTNLTVAPAPPFSPFDYGGGALFTRFGIVNMAGCTFSGNAANNTSGGAIHVRSSTLNIFTSSFAGNSSNGGGFGGAMWVDGLSAGPSASGGTLQITTSTFSNNTSRNQGGAIGFYLYPERNESVTFNSVSVIGNQVTDSSGTFLGTRAFGGGVVGDRGNVTILNSTFANNVVHSNAGGGTGGGLSLGSSGSVTIHNSTFSNNRAEGNSTPESTGGGLVINGNSQPFDITHATIAFNFAQFTGGGLTGSNGMLRNTIVANNDSLAFPSPFADQCTSTLTNGGGVLEFPANNPPCASGATAANPMIVTPIGANGGFTPTHLLQPTSPAIDAGACVLPLDQRGIARPQGPACDLGAVEMTLPGPATRFFTLTPCRRVDTRSGGPLACGANHTFTLTGGACGVPSGARAVAANVTVTQPSAPGNVNVFPASSPPPGTAIVNYGAGATRGNNAVVQLSAAGQVAVRCSPTGSTHVIIDVNGYFQ
jgi:hypothetical protein